MQKNLHFRHYSLVPKQLWRWPNFTPREIASKGDGSVLIDFHAMDTLQRARLKTSKPFIIHSAYRDEEYNIYVKGAPLSMHLEGRAFDIGLYNNRGAPLFQKAELLAILKSAGFTGFGINYNSFIHADTGRKRTW
jgi:uncharacterized protein YcbK (DUF882 family)